MKVEVWALKFMTMQQFNVPQFVEIEDKIIGPLTLRQFLVIVAGGIVVLFFWALFKYGVIFWFLAVPTALLTLFIALGSLNGRPVLSHVFPLISYISAPKRRLFHREAPVIIIKKRAEEKKSATLASGEVQNRLKRLAYILDQKTNVEEQMVHDANQQMVANDTNNHANVTNK